MPPLSGKQRKAQLQLKRAIKRGDAPPQPAQPNRKKKAKQNIRQAPETRHADQVARAARKLQSEFVKLDKVFLDETRSLAGSIILHRPISGDAAVLRNEWVTPTPTGTQLSQLTIPKRPKWKYRMTKEGLDANEQAYFRKWLTQQDAIVEEWRHALNAPLSNDIGQPTPFADQAGIRDEDSETRQMPYPPTHFERNIEVWRQFWRVTEISQILLVLLDSRCPPLHLPPSLAIYLNIPTSSPPANDPLPRSRNSATSKVPRVILVLTKVDISGLARIASWTAFLNTNYPGVPVVPVEAYAAKSPLSADQGRTRYEPYLPGTFRERLVNTIRDVHQQMLQPPGWVTAPRGEEGEEVRQQRISRWKPRVKTVINWENVVNAKGKMVGKAVGGAAAPKGTSDSQGQTGEEVDERDHVVSSDSEGEGKGGEGDGKGVHEWKEPEFLTIGLIGQPNVGKSSLLNAIFGTTRVRASRTPGKTKHFQTLFWTSDVRLVDCPGLVMPSFVPMDIQVLSGVLPISRISAVPFCVHQLARLLPLEQILELTHPMHSTSPAFATSASGVGGTIASTSDPDSTPQPRKAGSRSKSASKSTIAAGGPSIEDKRTWRPGQRPLGQTNVQSKVPKWTANDVMTAYAHKKGWVTAKAGRPDVHRAGNAILRLVAEGKIPWAFWPPGSRVSVDNGIWLKDGVLQHTWDELDIDDEDAEDKEDESEEDESELEEMSSEEADDQVGVKVALYDLDSSEDEEDAKSVPLRGNLGRFGALMIDDD